MTDDCVHIHVRKGDLELQIDAREDRVAQVLNGLAFLLDRAAEPGGPPRATEGDIFPLDFEEEWLESRLSKELRQAEDYLRLKPRLQDYDAALKIFVVDIARRLGERDGELIVEAEPDWTQWKREMQSLKDGLRYERLRHLLIHVSGAVDEEHKSRIADQVRLELPLVPCTTILTDRKTDQVLVEVVAYGHDLVKGRGGFQ